MHSTESKTIATAQRLYQSDWFAALVLIAALGIMSWQAA